MTRTTQFLLSLLFVSRLWADDVGLVRVGDAWRFVAASTEPSSPVTAWRQLDYNDASWLSGRSGFSSIGSEVTPLPFLSDTRSFYFRKQFIVSDPSAVKWLTLRLDYSSGFVAYLNGIEIARDGLAGEPVPYNSYASGHPAGATRDFDVSAGAGLLQPGTNVLGIQLHPASSSPSSYLFVPELLANFQRGPYLQNTTTHSVDVLWRTPGTADATVEYGLTPALGSSAQGGPSGTNHLVTVGNLLPGTEYFYRVRSSSGGVTAVSALSTFRTFKPSGAIQFCVLGDSGSANQNQFNVAASLAASPADLVLHVGDVIYPYFILPWSDTRCASVYATKIRSTPFFAAFGNHDLYGGSDQPFLDLFHPPENSATGTRHFYSFDHGDVHFVALYVPTLQSFAGMGPFALAPGSTQMQWLTNDLAATTKPWKILFLHSPLFTSAVHRWDDLNYDGVDDRLQLQEWILPVASQHGVRAIFWGHDHCFERFQPTNGVACFTAGGGGYSLYGISELDALSAFFRAAFHHLKVAISGDSMTVEAVDTAGVVFDRSVIELPPHLNSEVLRIARLPGGRLRLAWNAIPGKIYSVEETADLAGGFTELSHPTLPRVATSEQETILLNPGHGADRFYRLRRWSD